jgi:putative transcriptional regulator
MRHTRTGTAGDRGFSRRPSERRRRNAGNGGARKVRFARLGEGKRGGYRFITFFSGADIPVFLLSVFAKNAKSDLNKDEIQRAITKMKAPLPRTNPKAKSTVGQSILQGAREALAFAQGARDGYKVHVPATINVKAIREKVHMSQDEFARQYGFSKRSLEQWERGRRTPTGASRAFLVVIASEPDAAQRALARGPR